jgi:hypothetical protein
MRSEKFPIGELELDHRCQARDAIHPDAVEDYAEAYKAEADIPPLDVFLVSGKPYVVDGFHRYPAAMKAGRKWLRCRIVGEGTIDDAIWYATGVNQAHGLRRSNADKRRAVLLALETPIGAEQSSRVIAEHVGVSHDFVGRVRAEWEAERARADVSSDDTSRRTDTLGRRQPATKPKRQKPAAAPPLDPEPTYEPDPLEGTPLADAPAADASVSPRWRALSEAADVLKRARLAVRKVLGAPELTSERQAAEDALRRVENRFRLQELVPCPKCSGAGCRRCESTGSVTKGAA